MLLKFSQYFEVISCFRCHFTLSMLGKNFSSPQFEIFFLIFLENGV